MMKAGMMREMGCCRICGLVRVRTPPNGSDRAKITDCLVFKIPAGFLTTPAKKGEGLRPTTFDVIPSAECRRRPIQPRQDFTLFKPSHSLWSV